MINIFIVLSMKLWKRNTLLLDKYLISIMLKNNKIIDLL